MTDNNYTKVLLQVNERTDKTCNYDIYCEPLYWFVHQYSKNMSIPMKDISNKIGISASNFTKKLRVGNKQHRVFTANEIEDLCSELGYSLASIVFFYEHKEVFEKVINKDNFSMLTDLLSCVPEKPVDSQEIASDNNESPLSISTEELLETDDKTMSQWMGDWYFYFPSSDSTIIDDREKELKKTGCVALDDEETKELYDLYSEDHIYSGKLTILKDEGQYEATLRYMTNPQTMSVLKYQGSACCPDNTHAVFLTLVNQEGDDIIYMILDTLSVEKKAKYIMASVLFLSRNKMEHKHRPCSLRMILSRERIELNSLEYTVVEANLMMNDSVIRIDDHGYEELKKYQKDYRSKALDSFLQIYPSIDSMNGESYYINVHSCAYIDETLIKSLKTEGITPEDRMYLETLLRLHSIAPWYSKTKTSKINELLRKLSALKKDDK